MDNYPDLDPSLHDWVADELWAWTGDPLPEDFAAHLIRAVLGWERGGRANIEAPRLFPDAETLKRGNGYSGA